MAGLPVPVARVHISKSSNSMPSGRIDSDSEHRVNGRAAEHMYCNWIVAAWRVSIWLAFGIEI